MCPSTHPREDRDLPVSFTLFRLFLCIFLGRLVVGSAAEPDGDVSQRKAKEKIRFGSKCCLCFGTHSLVMWVHTPHIFRLFRCPLLVLCLRGAQQPSRIPYGQGKGNGKDTMGYGRGPCRYLPTRTCGYATDGVCHMDLEWGCLLDTFRFACSDA